MPFVSEIRMFTGKTVPLNWLPCDGRLVKVTDYSALFGVIKYTYGGEDNSFALPDLRGRVPLHFGPEHALGQVGGEAGHVLTGAEVPGAHTHALLAAAATAELTSPAGAAFATGPTMYVAPADNEEPTNLASQTITTADALPHENRQPFLAVTFAICESGVLPPHNG
jgi:microcystin-dependent protein